MLTELLATHPRLRTQAASFTPLLHMQYLSPALVEVDVDRQHDSKPMRGTAQLAPTELLPPLPMRLPIYGDANYELMKKVSFSSSFLVFLWFHSSPTHPPPHPPGARTPKRGQRANCARGV